jgi:type IV secretion system protein VirB4
MATLNKSTRPAAIMGIPLVPFVLVSGAIVLLAVYVSYLAIMLIPAWAEMKNKPERTFIISVCSGWRLKPWAVFTNTHFGANALLANQYDNVDVSEFIQKMKLNERITLDKYIPYPPYSPCVIRNRHRDLVATWELDGTVFECEDEHHLTLMATHLNNVIRSYEGLPVTFYIHRLREKYHDAFEACSGIPFPMRVTRRYYQPVKKNRSGGTGCFSPSATRRSLRLRRKP